MLIEFTDFNRANIIISNYFTAEWNEINSILAAMPLHVKASSQAGIQGNPVFDPVGTNQYIKAELVKLGWKANIPILKPYRFLGTDVDLGKAGIIIEVQFSHYSFLLNNTIRSELFFKAQTPLTGMPTQLVIIIAKSQMFPAANSSLYYEQAVNQLNVLAGYVVNVPIRVVGLFEGRNTIVPAKWTVYNAQTSRTILTQEELQCQIISGRSTDGRCVLHIF